MAVKLTKELKRSKWVKVDVPEFGIDFELELRPPTYQELMDDLMTVGGDKLELEVGIVTGWRGVEDADGKPVAFSTENLMKLLEAYPGLALHVMSYVTVEFSRLDGQTEKNSVGLSVSGSVDSPTTASTSPAETSNAGPSSDATVTPAASSD